jgi:hypothetical protein
VEEGTREREDHKREGERETERSANATWSQSDDWALFIYHSMPASRLVDSVMSHHVPTRDSSAGRSTHPCHTHSQPVCDYCQRRVSVSGHGTFPANLIHTARKGSECYLPCCIRVGLPRTTSTYRTSCAEGVRGVCRGGTCGRAAKRWKWSTLGWSRHG